MAYKKGETYLQEHSLNWNCSMFQRHGAAVHKVQLTMRHKLCLFALG